VVVSVTVEVVGDVTDEEKVEVTVGETTVNVEV
jgi:hypothetical protein